MGSIPKVPPVHACPLPQGHSLRKALRNGPLQVIQVRELHESEQTRALAHDLLDLLEHAYMQGLSLFDLQQFPV